eukprot:gb/GFBE01006704.1/.p1 GENE.gb/GFBE01006704.1/~~gb/GFBE01006704.1/.p1  ORF type:complete len:111 (+),score=1.19 gb/GFBE01006704.1/:1-333(+)
MPMFSRERVGPNNPSLEPLASVCDEMAIIAMLMRMSCSTGNLDYGGSRWTEVLPCHLVSRQVTACRLLSGQVHEHLALHSSNKSQRPKANQIIALGSAHDISLPKGLLGQ